MQVSFEAESVTGILAKIEKFCIEVSAIAKTSHPAQAVSATPPTAPAAEAVNDPVKRPPGRPKKQKETDFLDASEPVQEAAQETPKPVAAVKSNAPGATKEQATAALTKLNGEKGLPVAKSVLAKFGVERMSAVPPERYAEFISECNAALLE